MQPLKDLLVLIMAPMVGAATGLCVAVPAMLATGAAEFAGMLGAGVWFVATIVAFAYLSLWARRAQVRQMTADEARPKIRLLGPIWAYWIGGLGGCTAHLAGAAPWAVVLTTVVAGALGALIGFDYRRRVMAMARQV